ncbi:excinuclease ABC subunit UvrA [Candidatus Akkermansia timonensis]|nr:excinuclease ABC subunit UvrA [Candidatus Akkermansia timonensis]QWO90929.1 excinuclease ABC subunit UvrA [Candidatus Akkermansia timonensis]QWO96286.1 excinuclease ABC subunit UvrA [Candidatus Akkermansia timonensis]
MNLPISIRGARQHNLQNLNLDLPSGKLIAFSGPSGSGKSSLAFDTLFAESRRRFLDCLSARARQGIEQPDKPDVDSITGLPPALSLEQSARHQHPRTLLGSITEILDYLRILYAAAGRPHDPETGKELVRQTPDQIADALASLPEQTRLVLTAPAEALLAQDPAATLGDFQRQGFLRIYWNGEVRDIEELGVPDAPAPDAALVIDRIIIRGESSSSRLADSLQTALRINPDEVRAVITRPEEEPAVQAFHTRYRNPETGYLLPQLTPRHFSFNSPLGACPACHGTGLNKQENGPCPECRGQRLSPLALAVTMHTPDHAYNLAELTALPLEDMVGETKRLEIPAALAPALNPVMEEINKRTHFLNELGLSYLSLDRQANTLSGGELQRARLASQLGGGLSGVLYILDEPTTGLHPSDTDRLLRALQTLRNLGNTVLAVEHNEQILRAADHLVDMGPGSGARGGHILAQGSLQDIMANAESPTGTWFSGTRQMPAPPRRAAPSGQLVLTHANRHNLNNITLRLPLGTLTCISGPSGSGKSTLVRDCLIPALKKDLSGKKGVPRLVQGSERLSRLVVIDQSPIGKSPRSTPATATGLLNILRPLYAQLPLSKQRGYTAARFSTNVRGGRCERCLGTGMIEVDMNFLGNVTMPCDACQGQCYNRETLEVTWKGKSIAQALALTVDEAAEFFATLPKAAAILKSMKDVGLGYLNLDRRADTLSGGESQRIKIASELAKAPAWKLAEDDKCALFILDEPTGGLHFNEVELLLKALFRLRDAGHTVLCVEHHRDLLNAADHLIDMGPGAGRHGGNIVAEGAPSAVAAIPEAPTSRWLNPA